MIVRLLIPRDARPSLGAVMDLHMKVMGHVSTGSPRFVGASTGARHAFKGHLMRDQESRSEEVLVTWRRAGQRLVPTFPRN